MWFEKLTGFEEESPENVRKKLIIEGDSFVSTVTNKKFAFGKLEIPTLEELRKQESLLNEFQGEIKLSEVLANVQELHTMESNSNAMFQAASQFNLLEMIGPYITPEQGIDRYERDLTQGPACAIACGAGTIYRNYFVETGNEIGQSAFNQIDCLDFIGEALENEQYKLWSMSNGYALVNKEGLLTINKNIDSLNQKERENLKGKLKVGIQWNTEVTISENQQRVSQVYCSALPVAYSPVETDYWEQFSKLILEATYEATFWAALKNRKENNSNKLYLTLVGGGAFGNRENWILESLGKVLTKFKNTSLDVRIVSYGRSNKNLNQLANYI
ncbi:hypothetical protein [Aureivirga sp. CE67]|uniref:hypothetical protein n=1 Tax=Aureivirga sp. CE67 TaxID=1788983 RepID=UPI0018CA6A7D|nr:hypothetical protein [Aureivirga sp. CE67]